MILPWLEELRDLLSLKDYVSRKQAMLRWEDRWLVELHHRCFLESDMIERYQERAESPARDISGRELGHLMVSVDTCISERWEYSVVERNEVRGDVIAIRKEPKDAGSSTA